ncbi:MAG: hypothetical protein QM765_12780 [Myxococcales bacterium]
MTEVRGSRRARTAAGLAVLFAAGCATAVPLQTASTVDPGVVRLSGQVTSSPWCTVSGSWGSCALAPGNHSLGLPELRLAGRVGVHDRVDVGLSAFGTLVPGAGWRWGALADGKVEVWRQEIAPGRKHVLSAGLGLGYTRLDDTRGGKPQDESYQQMDVVVPLRYGYQFQGVELFAGPHFVERISFDPPGMKGVAEVPWLGLSVGLITRGRAKVGVGFSYEAPLRYFDAGVFNLTAGFLFDLGGNGVARPQGDRDPGVSKSPVLEAERPTPSG